jgi:uncharacterized protein YjbI with pentapeptide repeats
MRPLQAGELSAVVRGLLGGAALAVVLVLGSGSAYAATQITGKNIKNNTVSSKDIKDASLTGADIADRSLSTSDVLDATLTGADIKDGSIGSADINDGGIGTADIADGAITTSDVAAKTLTAADLAANAVSALELQDNAVDTGAVVDFGLSNEDVGVLFAQVSSTGTVSNSSGGAVTASKIGGAGTGQYEVDFARNVSLCAFVATIGGATAPPRTRRSSSWWCADRPRAYPEPRACQAANSSLSRSRLRPLTTASGVASSQARVSRVVSASGRMVSPASSDGCTSWAGSPSYSGRGSQSGIAPGPIHGSTSCACRNSWSTQVHATSDATPSAHCASRSDMGSTGPTPS